MDVNVTIGQIYTPMSYEGFDNAVIIIGLADKGPTMVPVYLSNSEYVEDIFGETSQLANACLEAFYAGAEHIIAFRINGIYPTLTLTDTNDNPLIKLYAIHAGSGYNMMKVVIAPYVDDTKVLEFYGINDEFQMRYTLSENTTAGSLSDAINHDSRLGKVQVIAEPLDDFAVCNTLRSTGNEGVLFDNGIDEDYVFGAKLYERLEAIYSMLDVINFDILIPLPVMYTDYAMVNIETATEPKNRSFYNQLAEFCERKSLSGYPVMAIASADEFIPSDHVDLSGYITALEEKLKNFDLKLNRSQHVVLLRAWISTPFPNKSGGRYISNGACALGGLLNALGCHLSPANKSIWSLFGIYQDSTMKYEFSPSETERLSELGICTFRNSIRRGVVISNAITSAPTNSSCMTIRNSRLASYINKTLTVALENYIGNSSINQYSAVDKVISSTLEDIKSNQMIVDYKYTVTSNPTGSAMYIDIEAVPYGEVRKVTASILIHL
jgi:hypothetical protein